MSAFLEDQPKEHSENSTKNSSKNLVENPVGNSSNKSSEQLTEEESEGSFKEDPSEHSKKSHKEDNKNDVKNDDHKIQKRHSSDYSDYSSRSAEEECNEMEEIKRDKIREARRVTCHEDEIGAKNVKIAQGFLIGKLREYSNEKQTGIQKIMNDWQKTHTHMILPEYDLKRLISIVEGRSNEPPDSVVKITPKTNFAYGGCCGLFMKTDDGNYVKTTKEIVLCKTGAPDRLFSDKTKTEFITFDLNVSLENYIKFPNE